MTAKAKAIQVLVAVSITAVAYTIYTNNAGKKPVPVQVKSITTAPAAKDNSVQNTAPETIMIYNQDVVPGYCNPDEKYR